MDAGGSRSVPSEVQGVPSCQVTLSGEILFLTHVQDGTGVKTWHQTGLKKGCSASASKPPSCLSPLFHLTARKRLHSTNKGCNTRILTADHTLWEGGVDVLTLLVGNSSGELVTFPDTKALKYDKASSEQQYLKHLKKEGTLPSFCARR